MEIVHLADWNFWPSSFLSILLIFLAAWGNVIARPTRDILLENDEEIKQELLNSKKEILASNQYIIDILEEKQKQF